MEAHIEMTGRYRRCLTRDELEYVESRKNKK
jgi:hypothetical protein